MFGGFSGIVTMSLYPVPCFAVDYFTHYYLFKDELVFVLRSNETGEYVA